MELLKVEHLCKTYGDGENQVNALSDISFTVEKGEFVAITGASGSGKSTLLHIIGGVDIPDSGQVLVDGTEIHRKSQEELAIFRRRQVGLVYQFYNLIPVLNVEENITLPLKLDGNLDNKNSHEIIELLKYSNRTYRQTLLLVTHDEEIALQADRIIQIQDGRIVSDQHVNDKRR